MIFSSKLKWLLVTAAAVGSAAHAQAPGTAAATVVAVPPFSTPNDTRTSSGSTLSIAWDASKLIAQDLRTTSEIMPLPPVQKDFYSYPEVTAPSFPKWRAAGAKVLVMGFVQARSDKRAQAIRDWLIQWGIAPTRLEARGFGGIKPLVPPDQKGAAKINDRLELIILERK